MNEIYSFCRTVNPFLAIGALMVLGYRVAPTILVLGKPTAAARTIFAGYILMTALGSWEGQRVGNQATYVSLGFTVLHISVIVLFSIWDFGLGQGIEAQKRSQGHTRTQKEDRT